MKHRIVKIVELDRNDAYPPIWNECYKCGCVVDKNPNHETCEEHIDTCIGLVSPKFRTQCIEMLKKSYLNEEDNYDTDLQKIIRSVIKDRITNKLVR